MLTSVFVLIETCSRYTFELEELRGLKRIKKKINKELTRCGEWKICHRAMNPLLRLKTFSRSSRCFENGKESERERFARHNWQTRLKTCVSKGKRRSFWWIFFSKRTFDCGNVSFLFFVLLFTPSICLFSFCVLILRGNVEILRSVCGCYVSLRRENVGKKEIA